MQQQILALLFCWRLDVHVGAFGLAGVQIEREGSLLRVRAGIFAK